MRLDWQITGAVVFCVVFVTLAALVYFGKVPADLLGVLLAWLVPSAVRSAFESRRTALAGEAYFVLQIMQIDAQ